MGSLRVQVLDSDVRGGEEKTDAALFLTVAFVLPTDWFYFPKCTRKGRVETSPFGGVQVSFL